MSKALKFATNCRKLCQISSYYQRKLTRDYRGLVLGLYKDEEKTPATSDYLENNRQISDTITKMPSPKFKQNAQRQFYTPNEDHDVLCFTHLGAKEGYCEMEEVDVGRENIRTSVGKAVKSLQDHGCTQAEVDGCGDAEAAAEGAILSLFSYDDLKAKKEDSVNVLPYKLSKSALKEWQQGVAMADAQNFARWLMESPANVMTPTEFARVASERLSGSCLVKVRKSDWIKEQKMGAFLSVSKGSEEEPVFLEVEYNGSNDSSKVISLVGKGVTFDTGGISIKPSANMAEMRADMGGAACTLAAVWGAARLELSVNIRCYIPLCENMPSGCATKPGDVITSRSGKTIQVDNTDAEGRLLLADALHYACEQNPCGPVLDLATLTGAARVALGAGATAAYSNSQQLWADLHEAGKLTADRMWRMPLFKQYADQVKNAPLADLNNIGKHSGQAGSCTAAAFLHQFVSSQHWVHLDIAGVMSNTDEISYLGNGMTGRPTRTLIQFLRNYNHKLYITTPDKV